VAADGSGRVLILQAGASQVLVFEQGLTRLACVINLVVDRDMPVIGRAWADDPHARGGALLLLAEGHVLVAAKHEPAHLVEFGPEADAPRGLGPGGILPPGGPLTLGGRSEIDYTALASWSAEERHIDDLALDCDGRLYALTAPPRRITRIDLDAPPTGRSARRGPTWRLPEPYSRGEVSSPEGLVFGADGHTPLISAGHPDGDENVVLLSPIDG
jgi:hypothetical protein